MNIQQMQYYAEVCRHENVTRAADALHMSQSTLSLSMKNIEEETGLNLFRHVGRNIQLTEDGHALLHEVEAMLKQFKRFEGSVREIAHRHNRLQIALPSQIATVILPLLLGEFRTLHPEIELEITEPAGGEALDMVEREEIDLAFVHDADDRNTLTLAEATRIPLVLLGRNFISTRRILEKCQQQKITPQVLHYSPHLSTIWNIVRQGIAFSLLTGNGIPTDIGLAAIPIKGMAQRGYIVTNKGRQIYAGQRLLIDFIRQKFREATLP